MIISSPLLMCTCVFVCLLLVCFNVAIFLFFFLKKTALDCYYYCCCWSCCRCCTSSSIFFIFYSTFLSHELFEFVGAGAQTCTILLHTQFAYVQTLQTLYHDDICTFLWMPKSAPKNQSNSFFCSPIKAIEILALTSIFCSGAYFTRIFW